MTQNKYHQCRNCKVAYMRAEKLNRRDPSVYRDIKHRLLGKTKLIRSPGSIF